MDRFTTSNFGVMRAAVVIARAVSCRATVGASDCHSLRLRACVESAVKSGYVEASSFQTTENLNEYNDIASLIATGSSDSESSFGNIGRCVCIRRNRTYAAGDVTHIAKGNREHS